jgi:fructose-1,6-bisphosphatase/inositol monophosphatase family enzyme
MTAKLNLSARIPQNGRRPDTTLQAMFQDALTLFASIADAVGEALQGVTDWGLSGRRDGQYAADLVADQIVLSALAAAGYSVLSEESGLTIRGNSALVIVDPLDGSTNASHGVPWYATSLCLVDDHGAAVGLVRNQSSGVTFTAVRGGGAKCGDTAISASHCQNIGEAIVGLSGLPPRHLGWRQFRALGASALDLCLVASGVFDGFIDCSVDAHGVWDYSAAMLICREAGADVVDGLGRELLVRDPALKRTPVAAATPELMQQLLSARQSFV